MRARQAAVAVLLTLGAVAWSSAPALSEPDPLTGLRSATARYHSQAQAAKDGFGELHDAADIACIDKPGAGGMGIHWVNGSRVGDPTIVADRPELVIYDRKGKLVAVEWVVLAGEWLKDHDQAPSLFGQPFTLVGSPNRYGLPPFFELHAWAWQDNASGTFADYNPAVVC